MSLLNIAIAFDQLCNTLLAGTPDETLSARAYRNDGTKKRWTAARLAIDTLFFWQPLHCHQSYLAEMTRKHLPEEYRG